MWGGNGYLVEVYCLVGIGKSGLRDGRSKKGKTSRGRTLWSTFLRKKRVNRRGRKESQRWGRRLKYDPRERPITKNDWGWGAMVRLGRVPHAGEEGKELKIWKTADWGQRGVWDNPDARHLLETAWPVL